MSLVSYRLPDTRLTAEILSDNGVSLPEALQTLRQYLPRNAILVGQSIRKDVEWLGLREGVDFQVSLQIPGKVFMNG